MSRYAERRAQIPPHSSFRGYPGNAQDRGYARPYSQSRPQDGDWNSKRASVAERQDYDFHGGDDEDDDSTVVETQVSTAVDSTVVSTAVGTDLSDLRPPVRGRAVSFGANEVEEFNGSEAPEAIEPAPSRMGNRAPQPPTSGSLIRAVPIDRPLSRLVDRSHTDGRFPADRAMSMPPPPVPTMQRIPSRPTYSEPAQATSSRSAVLRDHTTGPWFDRRRDSGSYEAQNWNDDDDDDAFTAIADSTAGTGVATDLSFDYEPNPQRASAGLSTRPLFPTSRSAQAVGQYQSPVFSRGTSASGYDSSYFDGPDNRVSPALSSTRDGTKGRLVPPQSIQRPRSSGSLRSMQIDDDQAYSNESTRSRTLESQRRPAHRSAVEDSPVEKELIALLKELQFSLALKDFHDTMQIGVERTLVAEDGMGHAYCKIHCKKLPRHEDITKQRHLSKHWVPIAGSRWEFRTPSHSVTVVFKTGEMAQKTLAER